MEVGYRGHLYKAGHISRTAPEAGSGSAESKSVVGSKRRRMGRKAGVEAAVDELKQTYPAIDKSGRRRD
jgi:hypothetical protein